MAGIESFSEDRKIADDVTDEKPNLSSSSIHLKGDIENELNATGEDLNEAKELADNMTLEEVRELLKNVLSMHENDPNFPHITLLRIKEFLGNDHLLQEPQKYESLIYEMKVEAALITNNSPYAEVRAVVNNRDDTSLPSSTVRAWVIGIGFSIALAFINQLFSIRQPSISVSGNVAQLLAYPLGKAWEKTVPDWGFYLPAWLVGKANASQRISLNPGPFNKKEHMLITIMAAVAYNTPYTDYVVWVQYLKQYFNQSYAGQFGYQIVVALSTNFIGYGLAGLCRRFLVYPAYCVWPTSLVTIALNEALHSEDSGPVIGPFKSIWRANRMKFFSIAFGAMFVYFWFPNYIFEALSTFSWMTWIAPTNVKLAAITGMSNGLGVNPLSTFDWNIVTFNFDPLVIPFFSAINIFFGCVAGTIVALALWFSNAYNTGYLPINSNRVFDNTGIAYNVSRAVDSRAILDAEKYRAYSPGYLSAGNTVVYIFFFAIYPATLLYVALNHRYEFITGMRNSFKDIKHVITTKLPFRKKKDPNAETLDTEKTTYQDVHNRLMAKYPEVSELWYLVVLSISIILGCVGLSQWQTYTSPGVVFYGIALCLIFVLPIGVTTSMTGVEVTLNVLAEFIGGAWSGGNALSMNYFKTYGYITCAQAIKFSNDLKLAHYIKVPPRHTFAAQVVATLVSTFVCTGVLNFQINSIENVCTSEAPNRFTCPNINTFFTASVLWGTIGPKRVFGTGGIYSTTLVGFPLGIVVTLAFWYMQRLIRKREEKWHSTRPVSTDSTSEDEPSTSSLARIARQIHPIPFLYGAITLSPYNISYLWPSIPIGYISWIIVKNRYLSFWSRYNFVLSAAFSTAIAISSIIIFFALQYQDVSINWWGNSVVSQGCEDDACTLYTLADGEHFGPGPGEFS